jgi:hypothetical protein
MNAEAAKSKRHTFASDIQVSTGGEIQRFRPSHIRADHGRNASRGWTPYDAPAEIAQWVSPKICFTLAEIEERLKSLLAEGQIDEVEVAIAGDKRADLQVGFLRHAAFLLAEARGLLDQIPRAKGREFAGIRAKVVAGPKNQSEYDAVSDRNYAENNERLTPSAVSFAFFLKRKLDAMGDDGQPLYTRPTLAAKYKLKERVLSRYLQLTTARPETLLAVHEGRMTMSAALGQMRDKGEGTARGKRTAVPHSAIIRAIEHVEKRPLPRVGLDPKGMILLDRLLCGLDRLSDETPANVKEWFVWKSMPAEEAKALAPEKPPRGEPKPSNKKAPRKPGETVQVDA